MKIARFVAEALKKEEGLTFTCQSPIAEQFGRGETASKISRKKVHPRSHTTVVVLLNKELHPRIQTRL